MLRFFAVATVFLAVPVLAEAQAPDDALKTCLADNTSGRDRKDPRGMDLYFDGRSS